ncbi:hypothetical protein CDL15_Pgr023732 [Punica granatum]|uniref:Retrotransposon gag domain-containing protein n=1 Tax=Punica granatum TaxID=22663 RepID=A0A218WSL6_PUNGR|nr:hypothetical protein CDL15_Pgr023732 [Punica granatum]PKI63623.1 hypothetical protein CRG98_016006 [Punica granatum]
MKYLAWISDVDRFFDYYSIPDDGSRVVRVVYRLRGKASTWWEKLENNRLQDGRNLVFTWRHMKQLLKVRFFPLGYEEHLYESEDGCMKSTYPLKHGKTNAFPMTIVDVEETVQLEEASMKGDQFKEEKVESKNEADQASQDNNVLVEKDLAIDKIFREELISNFEEKVQAELFLDPGQVEPQEVIAIEDSSMVFHPIEAKFAKAYTTPPRKQQFRQRVGWRGKTKRSIYEELLERVLKEKMLLKWQVKKRRNAQIKTGRRLMKTRGRVFFQPRGDDVLQIAAQHAFEFSGPNAYSRRLQNKNLA